MSARSSHCTTMSLSPERSTERSEMDTIISLSLLARPVALTTLGSDGTLAVAERSVLRTVGESGVGVGGREGDMGGSAKKGGDMEGPEGAG